MKRIMLALAAFAAALPCLAQVTDIKELVEKTPEEIIALYGEPQDTDRGAKYPTALTMDYGDIVFSYKEKAGNYRCTDIAFSSGKFCVMSDFLDGGFRVGDSFGKLSAFDFVHTPYGRGNHSNRLKLASDEKLLYYAYSEEFDQIYFEVEEDRIVQIRFREIFDPTGLVDYDNPYHPLRKTE